MRARVASILQRTAPGKFVRCAGGGSFRRVDAAGRATGARVRGITKRLAERVFSDIDPPTGGRCWRGSAWKGAGGGRRRGKAVDAQVSRLAKLSEKHRANATQLKLTRLTFAALRYHNLTPGTAQRVVLDDVLNLGTAIDVVCLRGHELVLVELKTGFVGQRSDPARANGVVQMLRTPFRRAADSHLHRHFAQLAATMALFEAESATLEALTAAGIESVAGVVLYVNDVETEVHELPPWWRRRGDQLLSVLCA